MSGKKTRPSRTVEDRLKDIQHEILVAVASGKPLPEVMSLLCLRAEEVAPKAICSVIGVDAEGKLRPLAAPSLPDAYSDAIDGAEIGPMVGTCGSAAFLGKTVETLNIKTDPRWTTYRDAALGLGLKACWSTPIKSQDRVVGTFAFYFRTPRRASSIEKRIVDRCVHLCALAIEHATVNARMRSLAYTDTLTSLGNRAMLAEKAPAILESAGSIGKEVAFFFVDVDGFRTVNDARGNKVGDQLLRSIADRIRTLTGSVDLVARLGGDEFLIVQTQQESVAEFKATARKIGQMLADPHVLADGIELRVTASIGVACFPHDGTDLDSLMQQADTALRQVKNSGRPGCAFYAARMDAEKRARRAFERDVSAAAIAGQLSVVYQPQADAATCAVKGFEALLRWTHPIHGFVSPEKFIPAAEASGAIHEIGAFVLREALAQATQWQPHLRVGVNVSPAQIVHTDFAQLVAATLAETAVDPSRLEIEVTESLFIYDSEAALTTLERIKALGVQVAIDDFGTGYSSLSTLRSFPFDRIKIDRSFITDMVTNKDAAAIVNAIMALSRAMERPVVAEGVETKAQLELLQLQGCNEIQGYLIGKPLPIESYAHITGVMPQGSVSHRPRKRGHHRTVVA